MKNILLLKYNNNNTCTNEKQWHIYDIITRSAGNGGTMHQFWISSVASEKDRSLFLLLMTFELPCKGWNSDITLDNVSTKQ